jgi:hypothetical protein
MLPQGTTLARAQKYRGAAHGSWRRDTSAATADAAGGILHQRTNKRHMTCMKHGMDVESANCNAVLRAEFGFGFAIISSRVLRNECRVKGAVRVTGRSWPEVWGPGGVILAAGAGIVA